MLPLFKIQESLPLVVGDDEQIRRLIAAVAKNSGEILTRTGSNSGQLRVELSQISIGSESGFPLQAGLYVHLAFKDNGPGLSGRSST